MHLKEGPGPDGLDTLKNKPQLHSLVAKQLCQNLSSCNAIIFTGPSITSLNLFQEFEKQGTVLQHCSAFLWICSSMRQYMMFYELNGFNMMWENPEKPSESDTLYYNKYCYIVKYRKQWGAASQHEVLLHVFFSFFLLISSLSPFDVPHPLQILITHWQHPVASNKWKEWEEVDLDISQLWFS